PDTHSIILPLAHLTLNHSRPLRNLPSFPTRRSSDLEMRRLTEGPANDIFPSVSSDGNRVAYLSDKKGSLDVWLKDKYATRFPSEDRKSTRLNSSHVAISYAVFCLKKKKPVDE